MTPSDLVAALRPELEGDDRVEAAYLFGSAARRQLRRDSDVDVGVRWAGETAARSGRAELVALLGRLGRACGRDVHLVDLSRAGPELCRRVYTDGVPIVERAPGRTRDALVRATIQVIDWEYARRLRARALAAQLGTAHG